jgi:hypothetical protein
MAFWQLGQYTFESFGAEPRMLRSAQHENPIGLVRKKGGKI